MSGVSLDRLGAFAVITIGNPPVNAMSAGIPGAIIARLAEANGDASVQAVILCGSGNGTIAGADIREFGKVWPTSEPTLRDAIAAIEASAKPVVAALAGSALGGGLELAMGCHYRVADAGTMLGQPEIKLGFPPGAGGTQRLPRLAGVKAALAMILDGNPVDAARAQDLGIIDAVIAGALRDGAVRFAEAKVAAGGPHPITRNRAVPAADPAVLAGARDAAHKQRGPRQAALACIDCVEAATTLPFDQGIAVERRLFEACLASPQSQALRHIFFAERAAAKIPGLDKSVLPRPIASAAVVGSGTMGSGITMCFADAGIPVRIMDADPAALQRGLATIRRNYEATAAKGRLTAADVETRMALITPVSEFSALAEADIIIEAVYEEIAVKQDVFARLDRVAKPGAILASNTSYLDIDAIAAIVPARKGYVLGTHFFSPANVMRLLEVVRTKTVSIETLAAVLALGRRFGKQPVVSGVCFGFIGNRMLEGYLREAEFMVEEGATPEQVDKVITTFGFPMGPFAMSDLAGLDIGWRKRKSRAHLRDPKNRYSPVSDRLCELGRFGQKTGAGWYRYEAGSRVPVPDPVAAGLIAASAIEQNIVRRNLPEFEILQRCLVPLINEGARILDEGIALRSSDIDLVWIKGYGFPAGTGGPMHLASVAGLSQFITSIKLYGGHLQGWEVAPLLARLANEGKTFIDFDAERR